MKKTISLIIIYFSLLLPGFSQQTMDMKQVFLAAESYYLFEEFDEALPLYLRMHRTYPDNYNIYYKIGVCYLNNAYEKDKSVFYLEKAAKNINPKYKESNYKELGAPLEALFFLGNAYRVNNELDKARDSYKKFQSQMDSEIYDDQLVLEQLAACDAAEKLMKKPVDMDVELLSNQVNTRFADKNPAVSGDETKMVFISKLQFYDAVFYTEKINGAWTPPRNITPELGVDGDVYPTGLSFDGTILFVYRNDDFIGNLYSSKLVNGVWTPLVKLNENINTKYWESHASITKDGNTLYFTSNRKGGFGGLDVYKSKKQENGDWGPAENLGSVVNSAYNEECPFITENGRRLFFSSYGHYNMGGYDVFMTALKSDDTWANPLNMGYPVNTTDDDIFFCPVKDGEIAYFPVFKETGYGRHDIYRYKVYTADHPRRYEISGILNYSGQKIDGKEIAINVISQISGDTLAMVHPNELGKFNFSVPAGKYSMVFDSERFERLIKSLEVSPNTPHSGITLSEQIKLIPVPAKLSQEELNKLLILKDSLITVSKGKTVKLDYEAEKGSVIVIKQYLDSVLVKVDTVKVDRRNQSFEFRPKPGTNQIEFNLTDPDGNKVTKTATIVYNNDKVSNLTATGKTSDEDKSLLESEEKAPAQDNINALANDLASRADGRLKEVLQNLDLKKEDITNTGELFKYLYENADKLGYSNQDVDRLYAEMISKKDLEEFLIHLKNASEGNLKKAISELDTKSNAINTPYQAVDYLVRNSNVNNYTSEDVVKALSIVGSNGSNDQNLFVTKLLHSTDEGELKSYLKSLDLSTLTPGTPQDFAVSLYRNASSKAFTEAEVLNALTNLAVSRDASEVLGKLIALAEEGALKDFLTSLDLQKENIYTAEELISHLYSNADLKDYTSEDVNKLLQKYTYNQIAEIEDLRQKMAALATGSLKEFLEKTNLNEHSFGSREEFIDYLKSEAERNGFTHQDINNVLLKLAYSGDLEDIVNQLALYANGNLKTTLENLDLEKEGIKSFDELIRYLLDNADQFGYTKDDVYKLLEDYTAATDLELLLKKLIRLADPETKVYLEKLDLKANGIGDRSELISYLLRKASEGAVNEENMIRLLLKATDTRLDDILPVIQSGSTGELSKILNSTKLPVSEFRSAADLYNYLLAESVKNKKLSTSEINKLFSAYLADNSLNQFLGKLIENSEGALKEFLQNIDLKEAGITSVSGLIEYLISNASANGYSEEDVFKLIDKVLGREKLEDFIANLREFASPGLARLLDQLDLEKEGITSIEDLMKYLAEHAAEFGYSMEDVWNAILQLLLTGEDKARNEMLAEQKPTVHRTTGRGKLLAIGAVGLSGIIIFLFILFRKKKKKD